MTTQIIKFKFAGALGWTKEFYAHQFVCECGWVGGWGLKFIQKRLDKIRFEFPNPV